MIHRENRTRSTRCLLFSITLVLLAASPGLQADQGGSFRAHKHISDYVGGRIGYLEIEDVDDGNLNLGFMAGYGLHRHAALAGALEYHTANFDFEDRNTIALTMGIEIYFFKEKVAVQPYLVGGLGFYHSEVERVDEFGFIVIDDSESEVGAHAGAGLDINCCSYDGERFLINLEFRMIFSDPEDNREEIEPDGAQVTVGLKVKMGN